MNLMSKLLYGSILLGLPWISQAEVQVFPAVTPYEFNGDVRNLPQPDAWQPGDPIKEVPRRRTRALVTPGLEQNQLDPLLAAQQQADVGGRMPSPSLNIAGQGFTGVYPPDTVGEAGPFHYIQMINGSGGAVFRIYDKSGTAVAGPTNLDTLGSGDCADGLGDPIVLFDELANRWLMSEFSNNGNKLCVYISKTQNPVTGGWWVYDFQAPEFPDYPKYGVWSTAYLVTSNENSGPAVYAFDRQKMLNGQAATFQRVTAPALGGFGFQALTPADHDGELAPPVGLPGILMRHNDDESHSPGSNNASADFLELWTLQPDFVTPANTVFSGPTQISMAEFDSSLCGLTSFQCFPQPSTSTTLDPLREVIMFRLQYRRFSDRESLVGNFVTDVNGSNRGGIRWFELRRTTPQSAWTLHQQGTYSPDASHRWMGSIGQDGAGNLALGYSLTSSSIVPNIRYVGRLATDTLGTLPQGETVLQSGSSTQTSTTRWGDYAALSIDPHANCTYWFTTEYMSSSNVWATRVGAFSFTTCRPDIIFADDFESGNRVDWSFTQP